MAKFKRLKPLTTTKHLTINKSVFKCQILLIQETVCSHFEVEKNLMICSFVAELYSSKANGSYFHLEPWTIVGHLWIIKNWLCSLQRWTASSFLEAKVNKCSSHPISKKESWNFQGIGDVGGRGRTGGRKMLGHGRWAGSRIKLNFIGKVLTFNIPLHKCWNMKLSMNISAS